MYFNKTIKILFHRSKKEKTSRFDSAGLSNIGRRKKNEDYIGRANVGTKNLFVLADGLGGHGEGATASRTAVDIAIKYFKEHHKQPEALLLRNIFTQIEDALEEMQKELGQDSLKTTLVMLLTNGDTAYFAHVGDSRLYYFNNQYYSCRTTDHSMSQLHVEMKKIKPCDIRTNEDRNRLLSVLGVKENTPKYEITEEPIAVYKEDAFVLCSDGFWEYLTGQRMESILRKSTTAKRWVSQMKKEVVRNMREDADNFSVIAVILK